MYPSDPYEISAVLNHSVVLCGLCFWPQRAAEIKRTTELLVK